jgi:branched-chain amino acid transport system ATP-binding protein
MSRLEVDRLTVRYGAVEGTKEISFSIADGETLALIGSNGAGKSSTLRAIIGLAGYSHGEIVFEGTSLKGKRVAEIVRRGIGYSPEGRRVFGPMTVLENLRVGGTTRTREEVSGRLEQVFAYLPKLRERASQASGSLSGGEQQMLAIGRALMSNPRLILLDEPSLGLAPVMVEKIGEILHDVQAKERISILLAEQNANWALAIANSAAVIELGRITNIGRAADIRADPAVRDAFLGM